MSFAQFFGRGSRVGGVAQAVAVIEITAMIRNFFRIWLAKLVKFLKRVV